MRTVVVTRHPSLVQLLIERALIDEHATVIAHATATDVQGARVIGVLPLRLASLAAEVVEVELALTPADRGVELTIERLREIAGEVVTYRVVAGSPSPDGLVAGHPARVLAAGIAGVLAMGGEVGFETTTETQRDTIALGEAVVQRDAIIAQLRADLAESNAEIGRQAILRG